MSRFDPNAPPTRDDVRKAITSKSEGVLEFAIQAAQQSCQESSDARETVESKASNLIGYAGVLTALLAGVLTVSPSPDATPAGRAFAYVALALFGLGTLLVGTSVLLGIVCLRVGKSKWVVLSPFNAVDYQKMKTVEAKQDLLTDLVFAAGKNHHENNRKATFLRHAQTVLVAAVIVILLGSVAELIVLGLQV